MKTQIKTIISIVLLLVVILSGCQTTQIPQNQGTEQTTPSGNYNFESAQSTFTQDKEIQTMRFKSAEELNAFLQQHSGSSGGAYKSGVMMLESARSADSSAESISVSSISPSASPKDYSTTNVQVQGVDEADIIKTDGNYIYTITGKTIFIIKAYPGEDAEVVSTIELDNYPQGLFVEGNKLSVFGMVEKLDYEKYGFLPRTGMSFFDIYDTSNKDSPKLVKDFNFEGNYFNGRMKNGVAYIVLNSYPEYRPIPMPYILEDGISRNVAIEDISYFPLPYDSTQFTTIHAIDLNNNAILDSKTLAVEATQNIYMSENNLYITTTKYINDWEIQQDITLAVVEPRLSASDKSRISKIINADSDLLSTYEKKAKVQEIAYTYVNYLSNDQQKELNKEIEKKVKTELAKYKYFEYTIINKVSLDNAGMQVVASGKVPGHINNQFSMDEFNGVFRIATTVNPRWDRFATESFSGTEAIAVSEPAVAPEGVTEEMMVREIMPPIPQPMQESINNIYTLDKNLDQLDALEGLAKGEQIFSTRFIGERLYLVTFRQVDPFFVIDLSNPANIKELGKLKIPGFSRYLHPYDANIIIGMGRETSETGSQEGLKISLFDVSNVGNPKEIAKWVSKSDYAQSTAEFEHKAFLFSKEKELLVIPAYSYEYGAERKGYNGAMVFKIIRDEIKLRGLVDHSKGLQSGYYYGPGVERSLYIEELLYTKSPNLLRINEIEDLGSVKEISLEPNYEGDIQIY